MQHLPPAVTNVLEGRIDPRSQQLITSSSQTVFIVLTLLSFILSYSSKSVLLGLEGFAAGFLLICIAVVPPWPFLNRHPVKFLPVRKLHTL
ncbi:uncharacterized protein L203_100466 [Cryptococcus depauperatus CBS 7841]|uniref:Signal peptidase complex subunit 1 n=1 Tax=Cryptococcus depauperatus CBS 7841 TaxID=1295531 RepID=A0AAJ8LYY4_9TREE